jgi:dTDP-4-amino-4,6-dideoxy-D-glucose acyltransferase
MPMLPYETVLKMGFNSVGKNVQISDRASFYGVNRIDIGNNVRIDDFCVLSAGSEGINIGNFIHIAVYTSLIGAGKISISDFCNLSSRVSIYSSNDYYSGSSLTNPTVPEQFKKVNHAAVFLGKHVIIGSGSVVLPGVTIEEGVAIGALSLVNKDCESFGVYTGCPIKKIKERKRDLLDLENQFLSLENWDL